MSPKFRFSLYISQLCCLGVVSILRGSLRTEHESCKLPCWNSVKNTECLYPSISRKHSEVHSDWTRSVHEFIFDLITGAIRMLDFGQVWIIYPIIIFLLKYCVYLFIYLFIYLWLCWVFVSVQGLSLVVASGGHSSSRCAGLSLLRPLLLQSTGSRRAGSAIVAHGPSRSAACGIFPDQGSNPCPLHWQTDSQPLRHQGSPWSIVDLQYCVSFRCTAKWFSYK